MSEKFQTEILASGKTATGIRVPPEVVSSLGSSKKPAVRVTINGFTYRSTVATMGGEFMLPVSAEIRSSARVAAGDQVDVEVELDTEPRAVSVPPDFEAALNGETAARQRFDALSYRTNLRHVLSIEGAKTAETRQRRIDGAIQALREGRS